MPATVLLETDWVLRRACRFAPMPVVETLRRLVGLPNFLVQHAAEVARALDCAGQGVDSTDALHLASSAGCTDFVSFDRSLARDAAGLKTLPVIEP